MKVRSIKTHKVTLKDKDLFKILDKYLPNQLKEKSVVVITSKIVAICQGRVVEKGKTDKEDLIKKESKYYLNRSDSKYNFSLTITEGVLMPSAGIDESNANDGFILLPKDLQKITDQVRKYLLKKYNVTNIGVIITDSRTIILRKGISGVALCHSGFLAINDYRGTSDIFGKELKVTEVDVIDGLASAAVLVMGEGKEQTPIAIIEDVPFVQFQNRNPSKKELDYLRIPLEDDLYAPLLTSVKWQKGGTYED